MKKIVTFCSVFAIAFYFSKAFSQGSDFVQGEQIKVLKPLIDVVLLDVSAPLVLSEQRKSDLAETFFFAMKQAELMGHTFERSDLSDEDTEIVLKTLLNGVSKRRKAKEEYGNFLNEEYGVDSFLISNNHKIVSFMAFTGSAPTPERQGANFMKGVAMAGINVASRGQVLMNRSGRNESQRLKLSIGIYDVEQKKILFWKEKIATSQFIEPERFKNEIYKLLAGKQ